MTFVRSNSKNIGAKIFLAAFFLLFTFGFLMESPNNPWSIAAPNTDSSVFKYVALAISKGQMPYRDTFDHKGPLIYLINYLGQLISYYRGIWVVEFITLLTTFIIIYKIARLCCNYIFSLFTVLICTIPLFSYYSGGNLVEEYAMPFIAISIYIFLDYFINQKINRFRLIICGFSFACVFLLRPNMIATWIIFCVAVLFYCLRNQNFSDIWNFLLFFLIGAGIIILPITFWLLYTNAFSDFIQDFLLFNFLYTSSNATFANRLDTFLFFFDNVMLLCIIVLLLFYREKKYINYTYITYLVLSILFASMSGLGYPHYGIVLIPAIAFPCSLFLNEIQKIYTEKTYRGLGIIIIILLSIYIYPSWKTQFSEIAEQYTHRDIPQYSADLCAAVDIISDTTTEADTISVYGNWDIVYVLSNRLSASRYSYQFPIGQVNPLILEEYFSDLYHNQPKWIIVQPGRYDENIDSFIKNNNYVNVILPNEDITCSLYKHSSVNF